LRDPAPCSSRGYEGGFVTGADSRARQVCTRDWFRDSR
jgi:hypothetical protein